MALLSFLIGKITLICRGVEVIIFIKKLLVWDVLVNQNYYNMIWMNNHSQINSFDFYWNFFSTSQSISTNYSSLISVIHNEHLFVVLSSLSLLCILILVFKNLKEDSDESELKSLVLPEMIHGETASELIIRNKVYMPKEKENAILEVLMTYEESRFFLNKNVSLTQLAVDSGINEKYIGYIIKKYKGKDFPTYINELRISYIVECLKLNPIYLQYKISYLASQCGFTSHSGFSITFKKVIGMTPSAFINNIKNESPESFV